VPDLIGVSEIAALFGVTRQRASEIQTRAGFPAPVARLKSGPIWTRASITRFLDDWQRRPGRPARLTTGRTLDAAPQADEVGVERTPSRKVPPKAAKKAPKKRTRVSA
jgi:hypothetical protein